MHNPGHYCKFMNLSNPPSEQLFKVINFFNSIFQSTIEDIPQLPDKKSFE